MVLDDNQNPIIAGSVYDDSSQNYEGFVAKYNTSGVLQWDELLSGTANEDDAVKEIFTLNNDIFVVGGVLNTNTQYDLITSKYNSSGTLQWSKIYNHSGLNDAALLVSGNATEILTVGIVETTAGTYEQLVVSYNNSTGAVIQTAATQGILAEIQEVNDAIIDDSGNVFITGASNTSQGMVLKIVKLSAQMDLVWTQTYQATGSDKNVGNAITLDNNGNVYVTGYSIGTSHTPQMVTIKYSSTGVEQWVHSATGMIESAGNDIIVNSNNEVFVSGYSKQTLSETSDFKLIQLNANGNELWNTSFNGISNQDDEASQIILDTEENILVSGKSKEESGSNTYLTVKYNREELIIPPDDEPMSSAFNYVENKGQLLNTNSQTADEVKFYTNNQSPSLYFHNDMISMVVASIDTSSTTQDTMHRVDMIFNDRQEVRTRLRVSPLEEREDYFNYYLGHIQEGREAVRLFDQLAYPQIYDGIDALYSSNGTGLKYYFVCHPNADPNDIELTFEGQNSLAVVNGELVIETSLGDIILPQPIAYKIENGVMVEYEWIPSYSITGNVVTISSGTFNGAIPLIFSVFKATADCFENSNVGTANIEYSTYYGGKGGDFFNDIDSGEDRYVAVGQGQNFQFPLFSSQTFDFMTDETVSSIVTFDKVTNERNWVTLISGTDCFSRAFATQIDDVNAFIYVTGQTRCTDFPVMDNPNTMDDWYDNSMGNASFNCYVTQLNFDGSMNWGTYLGSDAQFSLTIPNAMTETLNNNIIVVGQQSDVSDFPIEDNNGTFYSDADGSGTGFISEFDKEGILVWSTLFSNSDGNAQIKDVSVQFNDEVIIVGQVEGGNISSHDFLAPSGVQIDNTFNGGFDVFFAKFKADRSLYWSTLFGGPDDDFGNSIINFGGMILATGSTYSDFNPNNNPPPFPNNPLFPILNKSGAHNDLSINGSEDIFISLFTEDGKQDWTTYYGGNDRDLNPNMVLKPSEDGATTFITFDTYSNDISFSEKMGYYFQDISFTDGGSDIFILSLKPDLSLDWQTYFGGNKTGFGNAGDNVNGVSLSQESFFMTGFSRSCEPVIPIFNPAPSSSIYFQTEPDQSGNSADIDGIVTRFNINVMPTSSNIISNAEESIFEVFPNPNFGEFTLKLEKPIDNNKQIRVNIYNGLGQLIKRTSLDGNNFNKFKLTQSGIYFVEVEIGGKIQVKKIIIQ